MFYDLELIDHDNLVRIPAGLVYLPPFLFVLLDGVPSLQLSIFRSDVSEALPSDSGDQYPVWSAVEPVALDGIDLPRL